MADSSLTETVIVSTMTDRAQPQANGDLILAATAKDAATVKSILQQNPKIDLSQNIPLVNALIAHPDASTLQALCDHDPNFANFSIDYATRSILTKALSRGGPPAAITPFVHVLLDNGADIWEGFGPGAGALLPAIEGGQELEVVERIARMTGELSARCAGAAIRAQRVDLLGLLFLRLKLRRDLDAGAMVELANKTGNEDVIRVIEEWAEGRDQDGGILEGALGRVKKWLAGRP